MHLSGRQDAVEAIMNQAIPMHGRMIHGRDMSGKLWQAAQAYDVHGQVCCYVYPPCLQLIELCLLGNQLDR